MELPDETRVIILTRKKMLTDRVRLIMDDEEVVKSVEWFSNNRSDVLFNHLYEWRKLKIRKEDLNKQSWQHFIQNLRKDHPRLYGIVKSRRAKRGK